MEIKKHLFPKNGPEIEPIKKHLGWHSHFARKMIRI